MIVGYNDRKPFQIISYKKSAKIIPSAILRNRQKLVKIMKKIGLVFNFDPMLGKN